MNTNSKTIIKSLKHISSKKTRLKQISLKQNENPLTKKFKKYHIQGNIEFYSIFGLICYGVYYTSKHKEKFNDTIRLISAGISTHLLVDFITYWGDRLNTTVKIEKFYIIKKLRSAELDKLFNDKFLFTKKLRKRNISKSNLGHFDSKLNYRGIQSASIYVIINSIIFYGLYKNIKFYLKENLHITGFLNFFISAGIAQFVSMIFAFPMENIKTRMQASNFQYDSFFNYYKKIIVGRSYKGIFFNLKREYSGFFSHLVLYVLYESVTFSIYECCIKFLHKEKANSHETIPFTSVLFGGLVSGLIAAIVTNPIDVYQINKQINPNFQLSQITFRNSFIGLRERIGFILLVNFTTFYFLERIGPAYFDVRIE